MLLPRRAASSLTHIDWATGGCQPRSGSLFLLGIGFAPPCHGSYYPTRDSYYREGLSGRFLPFMWISGSVVLGFGGFDGDDRAWLVTRAGVDLGGHEVGDLAVIAVRSSG